MTAPALSGTGSSFQTSTSRQTHRGDERIATCVEICYLDPNLGFQAGQWIDVTEEVRALTTNRGRQAELQRFEAGTLTLKLDNRTGAHNTWAGSGINIGCPIRVRISAEKSAPTGTSPAIATYDPTDGGFFYAWWGFIEKLDFDWDTSGDDAWLIITAADAIKLLNRADLVAQTFPADINTHQSGSLVMSTGQLGTGADRVFGVLDVSGIKHLVGGSYIFRETWTNFGDPEPFTPFIDSGAGSPVTSNALSHLQDIAEAGFIDLYAFPDNRIAWRPFNEVRNQAFDTTTIFGDGGGTEIPYTDIGPTYSDENLYNEITLTTGTTAFGTSTTTASDATSIATYGRRRLERTAPAEIFPAVASTADYLVRYKDPVVHVPSVTLSLRSLTDAQRMRVLSLPIGYRVQVKRRATAATLTAECYFEGIQLTWEPAMKDVKAVLNLAPVRPVNAFVDPVPH